ncbi:MAG: hypothetical protein C0425_08475 [Chlorobiaceae bacterium]|nr:hypothetical protein [Chlorobiaceae bacterium]
MIEERFLVCKNCNHNNWLYELYCSKCSAILRNRIANIDFWNSLALLITEPKQLFIQIIQSDHKNFIYFIFFLISFKLLINGHFLLAIFYTPTAIIFLQYFFSSVISLVIIIASAFVVKKISQSKNYQTRFKDNLSLIFFSLIPFLFGGVILFPLEVALFGEYLFSQSPSPFQIKNSLAILFSALEIGIIIWSIGLLTIALNIQLGAKKIAIVFSIFLILLINLSQFILLQILSS